MSRSRLRRLGVRLATAVGLWIGLAGGSVRGEVIAVPGASIEVQFAGIFTDSSQQLARQWVQKSAGAVANYYGKFPVKRAVVQISPGDRRGTDGGRASDQGGPHISIVMGRQATAGDLAADWVLVHEMAHLGFPSVARQHHWLEEGLAVYIESIARTRVGLTTREQMWGELVDGLPQGQPQSGDHGLDHTPTWGRTYWGGALFAVRADVEIRRRTDNRRGLEDALRAIAAAGGSIDEFWSMDCVIATADTATGVPVWRELYEEMKAAPAPVDLTTLWRQLGVDRRKDGVHFDDQAPLAAIRRSIAGG